MIGVILNNYNDGVSEDERLDIYQLNNYYNLNLPMDLIKKYSETLDSTEKLILLDEINMKMPDPEMIFKSISLKFNVKYKIGYYLIQQLENRKDYIHSDAYLFRMLNEWYDLGLGKRDGEIVSITGIILIKSRIMITI